MSLPVRALLAAVLVLFTALPAAAQTWRTHKDSQYGYTVDFPGVPSFEQQTTPAGGMMEITSIEAGTNGAFTVVVTETDERLPPQTVLDNATAGAVAAVEGELVAKTDITVGGAPGRDLTIRSASKDVSLRMRIVVRGGDLYQVMAVGPVDAPPPNAERFVQSFKLPAPVAPSAPGTMAPVAD